MRFLLVFVFIVSLFHLHEMRYSMGQQSKGPTYSKAQSLKDKVAVSVVDLLTENNGDQENEQEEDAEDSIEVDSDFFVNKIHINFSKKLLRLSGLATFTLNFNHIYLENISPPPKHSSIV